MKNDMETYFRTEMSMDLLADVETEAKKKYTTHLLNKNKKQTKQKIIQYEYDTNVEQRTF